MELIDWAAVAIIVYVVATMSLRSLVLIAYAWLIREFRLKEDKENEPFSASARESFDQFRSSSTAE